MTRRALVVGLGLESGSILRKIHRDFAVQGMQDTLYTLWLTPYQPTGIDRYHYELITSDKSSTVRGQSPLLRPWNGPNWRNWQQTLLNDALFTRLSSYQQTDTFVMALDQTALRRLYYQPETRKWSGPNWKNWQTALASNRLFGKLAAHYHMGHLSDYLTGKVNNLTVSDLEAVNFYLIAPLHDPFASGALIDIAYILHDLALKRRASVFGLLMLPGMSHDPVVAADTTEAASQLRSALTYAALRELNFYLGPESFYDTHNTDLQLNFRDQSPFQTGDCLLIGGEQGEPDRPLDYGDVVQRMTQWVYLHTRTPIGASFPLSDNNRGMVSSFGIVQSNTGTDSPRIDDASQPPMLSLLRSLSRITVQNNRASAYARRWIDTRFIANFVIQERIAPGDEPITGDDNLRDALHVIDQRYWQESRGLMEREMQLATMMNERLQRETIPNMQSDIAKLIAQPGGTLHDLNQSLLRISSEMQQAYRQGKTDLRNMEREAEQALKRVRDTRLQYLFTVVTDTGGRLLFGFAALIVVLIAIVFFQTGLFIQMCTWGVAASVIPAGIAYALQSRRQNAEQIAFSSAQRELLNVQRRIVNQRISNAYLHSLINAFERTTATTGGRRRIDAIIEVIDSEISLMEKNKVYATTLSRSDEELYASELLTRLWTISGNMQLNKHHLEKEAAALLDDYIAGDFETDVQEQALSLVNHLYEQAWSLLATNVALIDEAEQTQVTYFAGLYHWPDILATSLQNRLNERRAIHVMDLHNKFKVENDARGMVLVRIRNNISLRALLNLERWRNDFLHVCTYETPAGQFIYRSWIHPTRVGVAVPDIDMGTSVGDGIEHMSTWFVMAVVIMLRESPNIGIRETLARTLGIPDRADINEDELCAALAADRFNRDELGKLVREAYQATSHRENAEILGIFEARVRALTPIFSERYADWQEWTVGKLRNVINVIGTERDYDAELRIAMALGRLVQYLQDRHNANSH